MILIKKSVGLFNERGSFLLNPRPEASEPAVRRAVHFAGNFRALRGPTPRFPDSVGHSQNGRFGFGVNLRPERDPMPRILDRVGNPKIWCSRSYVNLQGSRHPTPHFPIALAVPKTDPAPHPGTAQPSVRKYRVLPSPFSPGRAFPAPQRPTWGPTPPFPDSVAHSQNGRFGFVGNLRPGHGPMP